MKALMMRIAVGITALLGLLYFLACSPPAPNSNTSQNVAPNQNQANGNTVSKEDLSPCEYGSEPGPHAQHIKDDIKAKMGPSLKRLLKTSDNPDGTFTLEVEKAQNGTYFIARIKGKVSGDDNLKELSNILNDFQSKKECLRMIYFLPDPTSLSATGEPGFEWSSCEYPMHVCPNGECCSVIGANTNTNGNTTPLVNVNGNRIANTNK
jgi:hypothetical protein